MKDLREAGGLSVHVCSDNEWLIARKEVKDKARARSARQVGSTAAKRKSGSRKARGKGR